ncbi:tetratricopeptide repeat protein [Candidatus Poribacteria bacterium]|nr:tetratricopeptide repeat protein [Candidatus Poribacteria bacterium]
MLRSIGWVILLATIAGQVHADEVSSTPPRFQEAELEYQRGNFERALALYAELVEDYPDLAPAHAGLGDSALKLSDAPRAVAAFRRALELAPGDPILMGVFADALRADKQYESAIELYEKAIRVSSGSLRVEWYVGMALAEIDAGLLERAREHLTQAVQMGDGEGVAAHNLGVVLMNLNRLDEADQAFARAIARNGRNSKAFYGRGQIALKQGRLYPARDFLARASEIEPTEPTFYYARAQALRRMGRAEEARRVLVEYQRRLSEFYTREAQVRIEREQWKDALVRAQKAVDADGANLDAVQLRAFVYMRLGEFGTARSGFERVAESASRSAPEARLYLALIDRDEGDFDSAENRLLALSRDEPDSMTVYRQLARVREDAGKPDEAEAAYGAGIERNPSWAPGYWWRGMLREANGKLDGAEADYRKAIELVPGAPFAKASLALLLAKASRNLDEAVELARSAADTEHAAAHRAIYAYALHRAGKTDEAKAELERALHDDPDDATVIQVRNAILRASAPSPAPSEENR